MDPWHQLSVKNSQNFFTRTGKIRNYKVQAEIFKNLVPVQQKGRRVLATLQEKVDKEIDKLLAQDQIEQLQERSDRFFVSPIVTPYKNKYPMPNVEEVVDTIGQLISVKKGGRVFYHDGLNLCVQMYTIRFLGSDKILERAELVCFSRDAPFFKVAVCYGYYNQHVG